MFIGRKNKSEINQPFLNSEENEIDELQKLSVGDVLKTATIQVKEVTAKVEEEASAETEEPKAEVIEDEPKTEETNTTNKEVKMEIKAEDIMAKVAEFLGVKPKEEVQASDVPVTENGETMEQEEKTELEKVQEELKLATDKASDFETAKLAVEAEKLSLQTKIDEMNADKEAKRIEAEKAELSQKVEKELSFVNGTVDENVEKLYELKSSLGEDKAELFDFVMDSLAKKSTEIEASFDESGSNPDKTTLSVDEQLELLTKTKMEEKKLSQASAHQEVLNENPELRKAVYEGIKVSK